MATGNICGFQVVTADAALGTSGMPVAVFGMNMVSGGTAGVVILRNGTSASATSVIQENGTISVGKTVEYSVGVVFPSGCFVDIDANVSQVAVFFEQLRSI